MIACCFGGSPCSYDLGAVLIEQEDSRYIFKHHQYAPNTFSVTVQTNLAILAFPYEIRFPSTATQFIGFLSVSATRSALYYIARLSLRIY